jgi:hypothetical protein
MPLNCNCDELLVLPNQADTTCPVDFDQVVRVAFQLKQPAESFDTGDPITDVDSWTALLTASDDTKIVLSPALANLVIPASEGAFSGENSNESVNGLGYYLGENNIRVTAEAHSISQATADALEKLSCFSDVALGSSKLTAYMFTRRIRGKAGVIAKELDTDEHAGIEIFNFRISSVGAEGYQAKNKYMISFDMQPDALKGTAKLNLDFDPLGLVNVATT